MHHLSYCLLLWCAIVLRAGCAQHNKHRSPTNSSLLDDVHRAAMGERLEYLTAAADKSLIIHVHIPKAGGTALSVALSSECRCNNKQELPNCVACKEIVGSKGKKIDYSVNRSSGWKIGVHSPFAFMKSMLRNSPQWQGLSENDIMPVYVIMLRSPFERFVSEITKWGGNKGQAVDWSIVNTKLDGGRVFFRGANASFLISNATNTKQGLRERLLLYASLSPELIFHNRQVKMIGGGTSSFDMRFDNKVKLGSRWQPRDGTNTTALLNRAYKILGTQPDVIVCLEERFAEAICTLEIVYGHLYKFKWNPVVNSHDRSEKINLATRLESKAEAYPEVYEVWKQRNHAEEAIYASAQLLFEMQFREALAVLRNRSVVPGIADRTPHCRGFI